MAIDGGIITAFLLVILILVVGYAAFWIIDRMGVPSNVIWIVRLVVGVILLLALLGIIFSFAGIKITSLEHSLNYAVALLKIGGTATSALT